MKPGFFVGVAIVAVWLLAVPSSLAQADVPSQDQLSSKDVQDIIALLGGQKEEDTAASQAVPTVITSPKNSASSSSSSNNEASLNKDATLSQDELAQSLALLNTLFASNGQSPDLSGLLGGVLTPTTTTTTTTTENPQEAEAAAAQLLTALLGAGGNGAGGDAGNLAALLSLAAAGQNTQGGNKPAAAVPSSADAQNAALLTNLLLSAGGQSGGIKQQDFQSFQNAAGSLDPSSSNQLSGALNLLSTLGTLGSLASPQTSLLGGLLGGGNRQQSGILGLLSPQQQTQRPGLLASLGNLASVVGTTLGGVRNNLNLGPAKLRGVDTRLGLGYRFGENADAQVLWEIGPQLFTEPLTDEQKLQLKLQQEQLRLQQQQLQAHLQQQQLASRNPHRRLAATAKRTMRVPRPMVESKTVSRRHAGQGAEGIVRPPTSKPLTVEQLLQPPPSLYRTSRPTMPPKPAKMSQLNYYAKQEANPRTNTNSQLTEYEQFLLHTPHRNQIHQQQYIVNNRPVPKQRKDAFTFTKDANKNIVRVRVQRRQTPNQVQVIQAVGGLENGNSGAMMSPVDFSSGMGAFRRRSNPGSDESYLRRNAVAFNPHLREIQRKQERQEQQQVRDIQRLQREQERFVRERMKQGGGGGADRTRIFQRPQLKSKPNFLVPPASLGRNNSNRRVNSPRRRTGPARMDPKANPKTLSEWSENNSFTDLISNFVVSRLKSTGNAVVSSILPGASLNLPDDDIPAEDPATEAGTEVVVVDDTKTTGTATKIRAVMKGLLGLGKTEPQPSTPTPIIKIGEGVAYDELKSIVSGGISKEAAPSLGQGSYRIPTLDTSETYEPVVHAKDKFPSPPPEIFIDIANGEVSMRKAFGTMESFTPPPPEYIPEDHPRHVFKVLKEQLAKQYEKVKLQQLREAAKQIRKENIANGLANPHDPLYMASGMFDLMEKESKK